MASAACIKMEGVPVEFKVATIFVAMFALLPIPVTITLPLDWYIYSTAPANSSFTKWARFAIALLSVSIVCLAMEMILSGLFKILMLMKCL